MAGYGNHRELGLGTWYDVMILLLDEEIVNTIDAFSLHTSCAGVVHFRKLHSTTKGFSPRSAGDCDNPQGKDRDLEQFENNVEHCRSPRVRVNRCGWP